MAATDGYALTDSTAPADDAGAVSLAGYTPDSGVVSSSADTAPAVVTDELTSLLSDADAAVADMTAAVGDHLDAVADTLSQATADVRTGIDGYIGSIDNALDTVEPPVTRVIDKLLTGVDDTLLGAYQKVVATGVQVPYQTSIMADALQADPSGWLPAMVPNLLPTDTQATTQATSGQPTEATRAAVITDATGVTSPPPPPPPAGVDIGMIGILQGSVGLAVPADPATGMCPGGESPLPNPWYMDATQTPPVLTYGPSCPLPDATPTGDPTGDPTGTEPPPADTTTSPPTSPPPPPPAAPPADSLLPTPIGGPVCCPPQTITVTSPPPPPPPKPGPERVAPPMAADAGCIEWDTRDVCAAGVYGVNDGPPEETPTPGGDESGWLDSWITAAATGVKMAIPGYSIRVLGQAILPGDGSLGLFGVSHDLAAKAAKSIIAGATGVCVDHAVTVSELAVNLGLANWAETVTGAPLGYLMQSQRYQFQFLNPQELIGQSDWDNIYLRGYIDERQWECGTKALGHLPNWHRTARDGKQALLTDGDIIQAWRRDLLTGDQLYSIMGEKGFRNDLYIGLQRELSEQPLGAADIVRCMTRDSFDEQVVRDYQYDKDFTTKFQGKAKDWFYWQGYSEEQAKYLWRAHWEIPSNTALYEMLHRLRPDRQAWKDWDAANPVRIDGQRENPGDTGPPVVTADDVQEAMEVNDMAPAWVDRLMAVSYRPVTNTDAARMYEVGFIKQEEMVSRFRDNGYSKDDATFLGEFYKFERNKMVSTSTGVLSARKIVALYKSGALDRNAADQQLQDVMPDQELRTKLLDKLDTEISASTKMKAVAAAHKMYLSYEVDENGAQQYMGAAGVAGAMIPVLIDQWRADRDGQSRQTAALMLCKWRKYGLINAGEHVDRLTQLGYTQADSLKIARVCDIESTKAAVKEAQAELRAAKADLQAKVKQLSDQLQTLEQEIAQRQAELAGMGGPTGGHG